MNTQSFADISIVACGSLSLELNALKKEGYFEQPPHPVHHSGSSSGCHRAGMTTGPANQQGKRETKNVLVVSGGKFCYVNVDKPTRLMQNIIQA